MGDHISMALGDYPDLHVYKSMPYGTIEETLPYIARVNSNNLNTLLKKMLVLNIFLESS